MLLAHGRLHVAEGVPLPGWLGDVVLVGVPLLALCVALLVLEVRTRPRAGAAGPPHRERPR